MLHEIFYWILNMSITAAIMGLVVMLLRLFKKIPRRVFVLFWLAPFLRMCIPFSFAGNYSLMALIAKFTTKSVPVYGDVFYSSNTIMAAQSYFPITYKTAALESIFKIGGIVWLSVALVIFAVLLYLYISSIKGLKGAEHFEGRVYFSEKVFSPAVYGVIRPKIILPIGLKGKDNKYIILHEEAHIKGLHNLWRLLGIFIVSFHWFNPLAWVFLRLFLSDLELACDESVLSKLKKDERKEYALSLIDCKKQENAFVSSFGGAKIKRRIEGVLSFKKMTAFSLVGFSLLLIAVLWVLLTNAK